MIDFSSEKYSGPTGHRNYSEDAEGESHLRHPHCKYLYWYQEFLCPVEPLYFSDEKLITVDK